MPARRPKITLSLRFLGLLLVGIAAGNAPAEDGPLEFNRDIRPILSDRCFQCHGPDDKKREAGLRFDLPESAFQDLGGYVAIDPGHSQRSELIDRVSQSDPDLRMPPADSGKSLSDKEIEILRRWIDQGAGFEKHWAFAPPRRPEIPITRDSNWGQGAIDQFVLARLEQAQLLPSPPADRHTLIKRVHADLTGLLPTPDQVRRFVSDESPDAYVRLVDSLLESPSFGQRMGRHWLDLARYADSNGYANDGLRSIWPYRDWVIDALNRDLPFDQFTIEQLAGDLLPDPSLDQMVATGFHRNTPLQTEGGSDPEQYRVERTKNRTDTTGTVWFGLTVGCAQCHSHKFDPISHAEYYSLYAFFNNVDEPSRSMPMESDKARLDQLQSQLRKVTEDIKEFDLHTAATNQSNPKSQTGDPSWQLIELDHYESLGGASFDRLPDGSVLAGGKNPPIDTYVLKGVLPTEVAALRIDALTHESLPGTGPGRAGNGNFVLAELTIQVEGKPVPIVGSVADHHQKGYPPQDAFDADPKTGWAINVTSGSIHVNRHADFVFEKPVSGRVEIRMRTYEQGNGYNIGRLKLSASPIAPKTPRQDPRRAKLVAEQKRMEAELAQARKQIPTTLVVQQSARPRTSFIQLRGDFLDPGPEVQPVPIDDLHAWQPPQDRIANRLDLARWIMDEKNPLTARVQVNRMWQHLFGRGLVETENDFGYQGSLPSHPQLLDYLALQLIDGRWSMKRLYREILLSATYQQSSHYRPEVAAVDPKNQLLARQARFRVEAEIVRDLGLCSSGLLSRKMGGPSVFPPIPPGVIGTSSARHRWPESKGADRYRRGLYTAIYRANVHPMLTTFDGPDRDNACTRRGQSNTPLQALTLANDSSMVEMAVAMARRVIEETPETQAGQRMITAFELAMCRRPTVAEQDCLETFFQTEQSRYQADSQLAADLVGQPDAELAAWATTCRVLMNLDEFITRE